MTLRGNHREPLFAEPHDRRVLNDIVAENLALCRVRLHAYCWMTNHLHALVQPEGGALGPLMQRIAMRYARYRQGRMGTTGHLFERRYGARYIDSEAYFLAAIRYVHLNPVTAGLVVDPADYAWSSHRAYLGRAHPDWLTVDFALSLFAFDRGRAVQRYGDYLQTPDESLDVTYPPDGPAAGDVEASETSLAEASPCRTDGPPSRGPTDKPDLDRIAADVCATHFVSLVDLRAPGKAKAFSSARRELARRAVGLGISLLEVAAFLERDPSTVSRLLLGRSQRR